MTFLVAQDIVLFKNSNLFDFWIYANFTWKWCVWNNQTHFRPVWAGGREECDSQNVHIVSEGIDQMKSTLVHAQLEELRISQSKWFMDLP